MTRADPEDVMVPVPVRFLPCRKRALIAAAEADEFKKYTVWVRALVEAQIADPLHKLVPRDGDKR